MTQPIPGPENSPPQPADSGAGPMLTERFERAFLYASAVHGFQRRKGADVPYLAHLMAVTALVLEQGGDEEEAMAALLHDAAEDAGGDGRLRDIAGRFGQRVAEIVAGCSDATVRPKPPWRQRKEAYLRHLREASGSVRLVSAADKVHNLRCVLNDWRAIGDAVFERFKGGREGTLWYFDALARTYMELGPRTLGRQLAGMLDELRTLLAGAPPGPAGG